jgi:hypothetical protein
MLGKKIKFFLWLLFLALFLSLLFIETAGFYHASDLILYGIMLLSFYFHYLSYEFKKPWIKHFLPALFFLIGVTIYALLLATDNMGHGTGAMILLSIALILMFYFILHLILNQVLLERSKLTDHTLVNKRLVLIFICTQTWFHFLHNLFTSFEISYLRNFGLSVTGAVILYVISLVVMFKIKIKLSFLLIIYFITSFITYRFIYKGETTFIILGSVYLLSLVYLIQNDIKYIYSKVKSKINQKKETKA